MNTTEITPAIRAAALAEFGLWQDPMEPHLLVWRTPDLDDGEKGRCVQVLHTKTGHTLWHWETNCSGAARRYFEAHPTPKPWHDAQDSEAWALTLDEGGEFLAIYDCEDGGFVTPTGGQIVPADRITAGRRIWPEPEVDQ